MSNDELYRCKLRLFLHKYVLRDTILQVNDIGGVMVSVHVSSAVDHGFEPQLGQIKDYKICICCFSAKHAAFRKQCKHWFARNQNNVSADCCFSE